MSTETYTKGSWKIGSYPSVVVSDVKVQNTNFPVPLNPEVSPDDDINLYGGYLICESIGNPADAKLIAAAPDLLEALIELKKWIIDTHIAKNALYKANAAIKKAIE